MSKSIRDYEAIIKQMRATGREELIHYAADAHRDLFAAELVEQYLRDPSATESELRQHTINVVYAKN